MVVCDYVYFVPIFFGASVQNYFVSPRISSQKNIEDIVSVYARKSYPLLLMY